MDSAVDLIIISTNCLLSALEFLSLIINAQMKFFNNHPNKRPPNILISRGTHSVWITINKQLVEEDVGVVSFTTRLTSGNN
jgi:hypothetical protein